MAEPSPPELYGYWRSSATYRVRVALALKGIAVRETPIDLDRGEQLAPAFLALNPQGAVPALIEPGQAPITQSLAILEYLEERHPAPPLLPPDPAGRARVRSLALALAADTHPLIVPRVKQYLTGVAGLDEAAWAAWRMTWITQGLRAVEARLAGDPVTGAFCHGDAPTLADICLGSIVVVARVLGVEVGDIPTVRCIMRRCEALEAFALADPARQAGAPH